MLGGAVDGTVLVNRLQKPDALVPQKGADLGFHFQPPGETM
ncbi:hypothetical protein AGMMS49543_27750 [Betaproteobacteria bacterium]|nr:hypothetical protein AGMMS49543_27750 [Betaproteobacteria bacterium]